MKVVGIDSMVLIYAGMVPVRDDSTNNASHLEQKRERSRRSRLLLQYLARKNATVILPAIAVAELLVPVPLKDKGLVIAELEKKFVCLPFDLKASAIASRLWAQFKTLPAHEQYPDRDILKADAMIIGTAISAGATEYYTHDVRARKMAGFMIKAKDLPIRDPDGTFEFPDDACRS